MNQIAGLCPLSQSYLCVPIFLPECISTGLKAYIKAGNTCQDKWFWDFCVIHQRAYPSTLST